MRIGRDALRVRPTANGEQHHAASALAHRIGDRKRQCSTAADHGERTIVCYRCAASASLMTPRQPTARRMAMVNGREPARMKAIDLVDERSRRRFARRPDQAARERCRRRRTSPRRRAGADGCRLLRNPRRRMPTTLRPIRSASGPWTRPNGITSARTPLKPTTIAPSPMRTNWRTAAWPPNTTKSPIVTWPPSTTLLAKVTSLPTTQS